MKKCPICIVVQILAGVGALNWGLVTYFNMNLVTQILGDGTMPAKIVYALVGISGLITLITLIKNPCPCVKK